jgi:allophanate hydrolase subunit 2
MQSAVNLVAGESLLLEPPGIGTRVYLALPGGVSASVGGRLPPGSSISAFESCAPRGGALAQRPASLGSSELRVVPGPQSGLLPFGVLEREFRLSPSSDRTGVRLLPRVAAHDIEIPSEPACPGAVQATPSGELIVLGPDGPTIGGYPKVAVVCSADFDLLGQIPLGGVVRFSPISLERAREALQQKRRRLETCLSSLRQVSRAT